MNIPGYHIEEEIGHGGMATVYLAVQDSLQRKVALKVMAPALSADRTFGERFLKEARTVAQLSHPHILSIYDIGVSGFSHFIAMEYVGGGDLKQQIRGSLSPDQALDVMGPMAQALFHAHQKGFVHRDIKPENILFREDGSAVLTDFGIAKAIGAGTRMTPTGMSIGTPHYMSPEQARGQAVDHRSDLYSLGVVFYEMLTGRVPYDAEDSIAIGIKHVTEAPPRLPSDISRFQPLLDRLLAKKPDDRYHDAGELVQAVTQLRNGKPLPHAAPKTQVMPATPTTGNAKPPAAGWKFALAGAAAALVIGAGVYHFQRGAVRPVISGGGAAAPALNRDPAGQTPESSHGSTAAVSKAVPAATNETDAARAETERQQRLAEARRQTVEEVRNATEKAEAARQDEIRRLLSAAESDLAANRLTTPAGRNAAERYQAVLALDGNNTEAIEGLARIVGRYIDLSDEAVAAANAAKAAAYLDRAATVIPDAPGIAAARERITAMQQSKYAEYMAAGKSSLERQDQTAAVQNFKAALALSPGDPEASAGLKQAEKIQAQGQTMINSLGMTFVYIAPGTFMMGSPPGEAGRNDGKTRHQVTLTKGYWLQTTEVTVGQWSRFARETGYRTEAETGGGAYAYDGEWKIKAGTDWAHPGFEQTDRHPVTCVSWNDVQQFVRWMNSRSDKIRYRLPTEAEWEYACRAGNDAAYSFGGDASFLGKYA